MRILVLIAFIALTISLSRADVKDYEISCTELAYELISEKLHLVQESNYRIKNLNRLDRSLSELSQKAPVERKKFDFINIPPVFNHKTDIMTVNYMSKVMKLISEENEMQKKVIIKSMALSNLALEYKKLIPNFMNSCVNLTIKKHQLCTSAKDSSKNIEDCYNLNYLAKEDATNKSPFFQGIKSHQITL